MDGGAEKQETDSVHDAVIIVENEAESMPVQEDKSDASGQKYLDTCPVCHLNFHSREPKLLPCLHSFCKRCLPSPSRNLAMTEPPSSQVDKATKPLNVIRCPVCRQECMEVDVMENVFVKDSVEAPSSTVERTVQLCMTCDDNTEASGFCVNCVEYLCTTCVDAHQRVKFTRDHTIKQKAEISQEVHSVSTQRPMLCDIHKQEPLKLFCETCDLLTCRDCQLVKHKDHSYQFLDDAYKNHKQHIESLTHQLQEKKKVIEEVSNSINNGLVQVDQNRSSVQSEIKKAICSLMFEINKKGKLLMNQLEAVTKDHESVLQKQREDIGYLSRHLDHVISFTKWAMAMNGGTALLYCKRLILFQIGNLLRAKCSTSFVPQSTVRFQCRSSYWASNVDLGSLLVETVPGHQLGALQAIPHHLSHPGQDPSGSPHSFILKAPHNTLAQLQMQVDKLNPQAHWQPQPPFPPWTWYQSVRLQRSVARPLQGGSPSHSVPPQSGFTVPPPSHSSPTRSVPSPGFPPLSQTSSSYQHKPMDLFSSSSPTSLPINGTASLPQSRHMIEPTHLNRSEAGGPVYVLQSNYPQCMQPSLLPHRKVHGQQNSPEYNAAFQEEKPGIVSWKPSETHQTSGEVVPAVKRRRRSSPGPVIIIKDEPDDDSIYVQAYQRASLPDSTGDQSQVSSQEEGSKDSTSPQSTDQKAQSPSQFPNSPQDQSKISPNQKQEELNQAPLKRSSESLCAVCHTSGQLLCCHHCPKVFHLSCHVPTLIESPRRKWFCSLCCDLPESEMEYESKPEAKTVKKEPESDLGFPPEDKRKCERLLLHLLCNDLSLYSEEHVSPMVCANSRQSAKGPLTFSAVKERLEAQQSLCYQSPAEFVSDIRLVLENCAELTKADTEVTIASRKLKELFEEHLRIIFPDRTFPEIKLEVIPSSPPDSQLLFLDNISETVKPHPPCSDSQGTAGCPREQEAAI